MKNISPIKIKMVMRIGRYRGECMSVSIKANGVKILDQHRDDIQGSRIETQFECSAPLILDIDVSGKNPNDTLVGESGEILEDKCVIVENMSIDGIWLKKWYLESRAFEFWSDTGDLQKTNYFGRNGTGRFQILGEDLLEFWLETMCVDD